MSSSRVINVPTPGASRFLSAADWRFLIAPPAGGVFRRLVLVGGPPGLAEFLVESGVAREVVREPSSDRSADAVVVLDGAGVSLEEAARSLAGGGALYYEARRAGWDRFAGGPGRMRRSLRRVGLSLTGLYWVRPDFVSRAVYLPLDRPAGIAWYMRTIHSTPGAFSRRRAEALRLLSSFGGATLALFAGCIAVVAVAGPSGTIDSGVLADSALPAPLREGNPRPLVLARGQEDANRRVVIFPFSIGSSRPFAALKLWRAPGRNELTFLEQANLVNLRSLLDERGRRSLPVPLGVVRAGPVAVAVESAARGRAIVASGRGRDSVRRSLADFRSVARWLSDFQRQTEITRGSWGPDEFNRWFAPLLDRWSSIFTTGLAEARLFADLGSLSASLNGAALPVVWTHGDLVLGNVFQEGTGLTILDWAGAEPGLPLSDLLDFTLSRLGCRLREESERLSLFTELLLSPSPVRRAREVRSGLKGYLRSFEIDFRFFPLLLAFFSLRRALLNGERAARRGENPRTGNFHLGCVALIGNVRTGLFRDAESFSHGRLGPETGSSLENHG